MMESIFEAEEGRLREAKVITRQTSDGRGTVSFRNYIVEFPFSLKNKLGIGKLLAANTIMENNYLVLEVADIIPMHYGMINLDITIPKEIRNEIMKRVDESWNSEDEKETWIDAIAYPLGYILEASPNNIIFKKGYLPPLLGSSVKILNKDAYKSFVCARTNVSLGKILHENIPLNIDLEKAIKYHLGVFAFTGSGKSNLSSLIVRRVLDNLSDTKVVIFDVSMEYAVLLIDKLLEVQSEIVSLDRIPMSAVDAGRRFIRSHVIPDDIADIKDKLRKGAEILYQNGKMKQLYIPPEGLTYLSYADLIDLVKKQIEDKYTAISQKPLLYTFLSKLDNFMRERKLTPDDIVDDTINQLLDEMETLGKEAHLKENSSLFTFIAGVRSYISMGIRENEEYDIEKLAIEILDSSKESPRLVILELPNLEEGRQVVATIINQIYNRRKRMYSDNPKILFIIDEAQEFIPYDTKQKDKSEASSVSIEKLLRHGRKYHLHALISTQRLAYLNTNALQQLHSYFISTLPRPYDRQLLAETFGISDMLLDRTLELEPGQWLLVSFKAALPHDVPVFFSAENNLNIVKDVLSKL
ncbi:ATP-binding protein [Sulfolobus tengchongensis]|uniref:ATP-binding protein n=1 Tax=Sulfolobus tengchongensis TaxID=207809 RepID=A0AAX4L4G1_9CREN